MGARAVPLRSCSLERELRSRESAEQPPLGGFPPRWPFDLGRRRDARRWFLWERCGLCMV